jgi:hypothetical protein
MCALALPSLFVFCLTGTVGSNKTNLPGFSQNSGIRAAVGDRPAAPRVKLDCGEVTATDGNDWSVNNLLVHTPGTRPCDQLVNKINKHM